MCKNYSVPAGRGRYGGRPRRCGSAQSLTVLLTLQFAAGLRAGSEACATNKKVQESRRLLCIRRTSFAISFASLFAVSCPVHARRAAKTLCGGAQVCHKSRRTRFFEPAQVVASKKMRGVVRSPLQPEETRGLARSGACCRGCVLTMTREHRLQKININSVMSTSCTESCSTLHSAGGCVGLQVTCHECCLSRHTSWWPVGRR